MTTPARVSANRRNALRSTGPRTAEGKAASSRNAVKHGLLSRQPLLADEEPAEFYGLRDDLVGSLSPDGAVEELLVDELLGVLWRLRRLRRVEVALYAIGAPVPVREALRRRTGRSSLPDRSRTRNGHDKIAEAAVIRLEYGNVPHFLVDHGYGPDGKNPTAELRRAKEAKG